MAWASGGKVSPAQRQICGDREHLGRQIPWLDTFCHLTVSLYSKLTFLFYCFSPNSSPTLCCHKLCTGKHGPVNVMMGKESVFPSTNRTCSSTLYTVCLWIVLLLQSARLLRVEGVMQPCNQGRMMSPVSSPRLGQVLRVESQGQHRSAVPWEGGLTWYQLPAQPGSTTTQLNPSATRAELKHLFPSSLNPLSKQGGFVSHEGCCIPLSPCQQNRYYCLPMPQEKKEYPLCILF